MIPLALPLAGSALSSAESAVKSLVSGVVNSVVGVFDPGKARDATREARAEMWYQLALKGSLYAARHVYGGQSDGTNIYTIKEKGYYTDRFNKLTTAMPALAQQARIAGGLNIPDNPTQAEINQMASEISTYQNANILYAPYGTGIPNSTISFTPLANAPAPVPVVPVAAGGAQMLPMMTTTAKAPTHTALYIAIGLAVLVVLFVVLRHKGK